MVDNFGNKIYDEKEVSTEAQFLDKMKSKLKNYKKEEKNGIMLYRNKEDHRIVAFEPSENCLVVCTTTKMENHIDPRKSKKAYEVFNRFNPIFVLFTSGNYDQKLIDDITLVARITKSAGDLNLFHFTENSLVIGEFPYEKEYKTPNNVFYNKELQKLNIKSIAAMTRNSNKVTIKSDESGSNGFTFRYDLESISVTSDHSNYAYLCSEQEKRTEKTLKLTRKGV